MSNIQFGSGVVFGKPSAGNLPVLPTPLKFGVLQEANVDFKGDLKKLFGQFQFPVATARGKLEVTIKGKLAVFDIRLLNQLYFAQPESAGYNLIVDGDLVPFLTINAAAATVSNIPIVEDWGVKNRTTGQNFQYNSNVAALTQGQYFVNLTTGVYTFNTLDNGVKVSISYTYFVNSGVTITLNSQLMGYAPELTMFLYNRFRNKYLALELNDVTLGSINIPTKLEDFWIMDFDGSANVDASNVLGTLMADLF
jgi:hypothetical protein